MTQLENKRVESLPYSSNDQNKVDERFTFIYCVWDDFILESTYYILNDDEELTICCSLYIYIYLLMTWPQHLMATCLLWWLCVSCSNNAVRCWFLSPWLLLLQTVVSITQRRVKTTKVYWRVHCRLNKYLLTCLSASEGSHLNSLSLFHFISTITQCHCGVGLVLILKLFFSVFDFCLLMGAIILTLLFSFCLDE